MIEADVAGFGYADAFAQHRSIACGARLVAKDSDGGALPVWRDARWEL